MRWHHIALAAIALTGSVAAIEPVEIRAVSAVPAHLAGQFRRAAGFQQSAPGQYFVFDRASHAIYGIDERQTTAWEIVRIGPEPGRIIDPTAFSVEPGGSIAVADAPNNRERVQFFASDGRAIGGFTLPGRSKARVTLGDVVISGVGSLQYTGNAVFMSQPENGALVTEYRLDGGVRRTFGRLRETGHDEDRDLHLALNSGIPLVDPTGGFYFVFQSGEPVFRKYDAAGLLTLERRMVGREIDPIVAALPTTWPRRQTSEGELPVVTPTIRAAAVDRLGHLWVSFVAPYTYVYDRDGDKIRTLQFRGAGLISPTSLFFAASGRLLVTPGLYEFDVR
jgi:hypothetical protein